MTATTLRFACRCGALTEAPPWSAGLRRRCGSCRAHVQVPGVRPPVWSRTVVASDGVPRDRGGEEALLEVGHVLVVEGGTLIACGLLWLAMAEPYDPGALLVRPTGGLPAGALLAVGLGAALLAAGAGLLVRSRAAWWLAVALHLGLLAAALALRAWDPDAVLAREGPWFLLFCLTYLAACLGFVLRGRGVTRPAYVRAWR